MSDGFLMQATCERLPIADNSIDLIFTDPPYPREFLSCYEWLAHESMRVLKSDGFVLSMCGGSYLNQIFSMFDRAGLVYFWKYELAMTGASGGQTWVHRNGSKMPINTWLKSILAYSKGDAVARCQTADVFNGNGSNKLFHHWGQDVASARYYIDCFSRPGDLVLDPFIGGGTTGVACELIGRRWIGCDVDPMALATTQKRMREAEIPQQALMFAEGAK